jgi:hypothetical protein
MLQDSCAKARASLTMAAGTLPRRADLAAGSAASWPWPTDQAARTRVQGARLTDQLQAIGAISANRSPAGAGSREILRQLSAMDQAPGAQLDGQRNTASWPRTTDHGPRTRPNWSGYHYARATDNAPRPEELGPGLTGIRQRPARPGEIPGKPATPQGLDCTDQGAAGQVNQQGFTGIKKPGQLAGFKLQLQRLTNQVQQLAGLLFELYPIGRPRDIPGICGGACDGVPYCLNRAPFVR